MPTFSVIIPTKNEEELLPHLLQAIKEQTLQPKEIIVADAQSTDATRAIAASFGARVIEGGLPAFARNRGAETAHTDALFFLDADMILPDASFFSRALDEFSARQLDIAATDVLPIGGKWYDTALHGVYNGYVRLWGRLRPHAPGGCMLVLRTLHERIGGFDETIVFCEDHDYAMRAGKQGRFGFLSSVHILTPVRRQERDGRMRMAITFLLAELHLMFLGPIRHHGFRYGFGYKKTQNKE